MSENKLGFPEFVGASLNGLLLKSAHPEYFYSRGPKGVVESAPLTAMFAAFPEELGRKKIESDPALQQRLRLATQLIRVSISANDFVDMHEKVWLQAAGSKTKPSDDLQYMDGQEQWKHHMEQVGYNDKTLLESDRGIFKSFLSGIVRLNRLVRENLDRSLETVLEAKELENAINLTHVAAVLFGTEDLPQSALELDSQGLDGHKQLSLSEMKARYEWLIHGQPENETQTKLCALFNLVMITQIIDDWRDRDIDSKLGIHSIGLSLMESTKGDENLAEKKKKRGN